MDKPLFQPFPPELIFRNFTPAQTYKLQLQLHNNDKVCVCVCASSPSPPLPIFPSAGQSSHMSPVLLKVHLPVLQLRLWVSRKPGDGPDWNRRCLNKDELNWTDSFLLQVSRQVKPELQESQFFKVVPQKNAGRKVAPGMSVVYTICFSPQENKVLVQRWVELRRSVHIIQAGVNPFGEKLKIWNEEILFYLYRRKSTCSYMCKCVSK